MLLVNPRSHIFHYPNHLYRVEDPRDRMKLPPRDEPYWWAIAFGRHLGYRRGKTRGTWHARIRLQGGRYRRCSFGLADDDAEADGEQVLNFTQAIRCAEAWFGDYADRAINPVAPSMRRPEIPEPPSGESYTVAHALADYLRWYRENKRDLRTQLYAANAFILPRLGHIPLSELTAGQIAGWFHELSVAPARVRRSSGHPVRHMRPPRSPEELRRRRNTANRILSLLKAALAKAYYAGHVDTESPWQRVRKHRNVDQPRLRYLDKDECRALLSACEPDLADLVRGALLTGCRAGELQRMKVRDYVAESGKLFLERTKSGQPRTVTLTAEGMRFFSALVRGRSDDEYMFVRRDARPWGRDHYDKQLKVACRRARIHPPISFHTLRHTYASHAAMAGIPLIVIAKQLGHADTRMVEKHYAHLAQSFIDQQIRALMPPLV